MLIEKRAGELVVGKGVLELGSGLGLCGIAASFCGARQSVLTDLEYILDVTRDNVKLNMVDDVTRVEPLDWFSPEKSSIDWTVIDVILASDTIWLEQLIEPFVNTLIHHSSKPQYCGAIVEPVEERISLD